jgi:hypothetical protein
MRFAYVLAGVLTMSSLAIAQAPPPGEPPPAGPPGSEPMPPPPPPAPPAGAPAAVMAAPPAPVPTTVDKGTLEDANAGRAWMSPTALTPPAGTWSFEDFELFLIGVSYAVTDNFVITGTTMVPITSDLYWGFVSGKAQVLRAGSLRIAIQGGLAAAAAKDTTTTFDSMGNPISTMSTTTTTSGAEIGAAATLCLDVDCFSHIDGFVGTAFAYQNNSSVPVAFSASLVQKIGRRVRLVIEADTAHLFGDISGQANGILGWYGLRFTSRSIGVDAGLVKPFCSDCSSDSFPLGFPIVSFSYRGID